MSNLRMSSSLPYNYAGVQRGVCYGASLPNFAGKAIIVYDTPVSTEVDIATWNKHN